MTYEIMTNELTQDWSYTNSEHNKISCIIQCITITNDKKYNSIIKLNHIYV